MKSFQISMLVARTEALLFVRSWVFRFLVLVTFGVIGFYSCFIFAVDFGGDQLWMFRAIPSEIPYFVFLLLTVFECLIVIFGSIDTIQRDHTIHTYASLHAHDFTNISYVTGKLAGVLLPCLVLDLIFAILTLVLTFFFIDDVPVSLSAYVIYTFLLNLPALLFIAGLSFAITSIVKSKPFAMMILVAYFAMTFVLRDGPIALLFDFTGVHMPFLTSSMVGLENMQQILLQRGFTVFLAICGLIIATLLFDRLPQSLRNRRRAGAFAVVCLLCAVITGAAYTGHIYRGIRLRERIVTLNEEYAETPRARLTACNLNISHHGSQFDVTAILSLENHQPQALSSIILSLNPGFTVQSVTNQTTELAFDRNAQIIDVALPTPLAPGDETVLTVTYDGTIDDRACYPEIEPLWRIKPNRLFTNVINNRYGFITDSYILLTPECQWYPASGIPNNLIFPGTNERDFIDFSLDISTENDRTVISQGTVDRTDSGSYSIRPETKLTGLSLIMGEYEKKSIDVDGVEIAVFHYPGHDYFTALFKAEQETIVDVVKQVKNEYEIEKGMKYPFQRYYLVETPVQFHSFPRSWSTYTETTQPQLSLVPEMGYFVEYFNIFNRRYSHERNIRLRGQTTDEYEMTDYLIRVLTRYVFLNDDTIENNAYSPSWIDREWLMEPINPVYIPPYTVSAQFYPFVASIESDTLPLLNTHFEFYSKHGVDIGSSSSSRLSNALFDDELLSMVLQQNYEQGVEVLNDNTKYLNIYLKLKSYALFGTFQALTGNTDFDDFYKQFISEHTFERVTFDQFVDAFRAWYDLSENDVYDVLEEHDGLPLFTISNVSLTEHYNSDYPTYQTMFTVTNSEPVPGTMCVRLWHPESKEYINRYISLNGHQSKEVSIISDTLPSDMRVSTLLSKNLPLSFYIKLGTPKQNDSQERFDGERILPYSPPAPEPGTIVVDNLDDGFEIIREPNLEVDGEHYHDVYKYGKYPDEFVNCIPYMPPQRWGKAIFNSSYGSISTAYYTRYGNGDGRVAWHAEIKETGTYDLEYYIADFAIENGHIEYMRVSDEDRAKPLLGDYNLCIASGGQEQNITFMPSEDQPGWQYVSTFDLEPEEVTVELSNKTSGRCVYADAIRWVKRNGEQ